MMFRRIYWVVESVSANGPTALHGVFTSLQDLLLVGLAANKESIRLSLVKLDAPDGVIGKWDKSNFAGIRSDLQQYIESGEFSIENCDLLAEALNK